MRQERTDINVPFCGPAILHARVMNDGDQAVPVLTDIKDHISLHIIGILENLPDFHEVPPPRGLRDFVPGHNLFGGIWILLHSPVQVLFGDDMHEGSSVTRTVALPKILCKLKSVNRNFAF
jgi:hypothetical protein